MTLAKTICDFLEHEAERRSKATVHELADEAAQGVDDALCSWLGPTMASRWWRGWVRDQIGRTTDPLADSHDDNVLAEGGGGEA